VQVARFGPFFNVVESRFLERVPVWFDDGFCWWETQSLLKMKGNTKGDADTDKHPDGKKWRQAVN